jgi:hypothetical protein
VDEMMNTPLRSWTCVGFDQVTDARLKHLVALKNLTQLTLSDTRVTDAGEKEIQ